VLVPVADSISLGVNGASASVLLGPNTSHVDSGEPVKLNPPKLPPGMTGVLGKEIVLLSES
jgi:hypothetical protein